MKTYPRDLAVKILTRVLSDQQALDQALAELALDAPPDTRAWLQEVCSGTLRWRGRLDLAIDSIALKKKPSGWLRKMILLTAYQLVAQDRTPAGRVVSETVTDVKVREGEAPSKFANALLRKVADHAQDWRSMDVRAKAPLAEQARWASLPEWLWKKLVLENGLDGAKAYARASLDRPGLWIHARRADWAPPQEALWSDGPVPGSKRLQESAGLGQISEWAGFKEGEFFVQDISSQTLVHEISREVRESLGTGPLRVLDLCAAPGGKTAGLAWNGFQVSASDRDESRYALLRQTVDRVGAGTRIQVVPRDAVGALPDQDLVWVDAPCTGTGILRRHPDVRWLRQEKELSVLGKLQAELIQQAWEKVRPGGFLAYSVCSVLREEGSGRIESAKLAGSRVKDWSLLPQSAPFGDGFWATLIRKS